MSELKVDNHIIREPIINILNKLKSELHNGLLKDIAEKSEDVIVTCPRHKGGNESHPSLQIYNKSNNPKLERGFFHCFTCQYSGPLYRLVADCLEVSEEYGKKWLIDNFSDGLVIDTIKTPEIDLSVKKEENSYLDPSTLIQYDYYHPYMWQRKLTKEVVDKFRVGYDKVRDAITFPVWDEKNNLIMVTKRSTKTKSFYIEKGKEKPVYLLNYAQATNFPFIIVCESQIDALYAWSLGYPAIAMIGVGSPHQYKVLNKCPIRSYALMFDNDNAGRKASKEFQNNIRKDVFIINVDLPSNRKDINDLSREEFENTLRRYQLIS